MIVVTRAGLGPISERVKLFIILDWCLVGKVHDVSDDLPNNLPEVN